jgi:hypothetical protein
MRNQILYRVAGGPCVKGFVDTIAPCAPGAAPEVWDAAVGGGLVVGAVITPKGECPLVVTTAPTTAIGVDCSGNPVTATAVGVAQTVPHPTAVQNVKVCGPIANFKIEFSETLLFSASTEQSIYRVKEYNEGAGTWVTRYESLDGTPFTGTLPTDLNRVSALANVTRTQVLGCAAGVPYAMRETSRFDAETGALESEVIDWVDSAGVVATTLPVGFKLGACRELCAASTAHGLTGWGF